MRVFVISLEDAEKRRAQVESQMRWAGIEFSFFDALSGDDGFEPHFEAYDQRQYILRTGRVATPGEIGCFASHRALWKRCVALGTPVMIMEDDCRLRDLFPEAFRETRRLVGHYGFIRLQTESRAESRKVGDAGRFSLHRYTKAPHSLACYALTPRVASALVATSSTLSAPADVFVKRFWDHGQQLYGLQPYAVLESALSERSHIGARPKADKSLGLQAARLLEKGREEIRRQSFNARGIELPTPEPE